MRKRSNYIGLEKKLSSFGICLLNDILKLDPHFDSRRLNEWQKKGYITKLIKGVYIFNSIETDESVLFQIANHLSRPSYVSLETALSFYHLIPEQSFTITSVTTLKTNHYETPKGNFIYQSVKPSLFFGYRVLPSQHRPILIAEPEKALLDLLYLRPELNDGDSIAALRWNTPEKEFFDEQKLENYLRLFNSNALNRRLKIFKKVTHAAII